MRGFTLCCVISSSLGGNTLLGVERDSRHSGMVAGWYAQLKCSIRTRYWGWAPCSQILRELKPPLPHILSATVPFDAFHLRCQGRHLGSPAWKACVYSLFQIAFSKLRRGIQNGLRKCTSQKPLSNSASLRCIQAVSILWEGSKRIPGNLGLCNWKRL